jgi:hypothetical protein
LVLDEWITFDRTGDYEIGIRLNAGFKSRSGVELNPATGATLHFHVDAPDVARLWRSCESLSSVAVAGPTLEARLDAEAALIHLVDPSIVPCLRETLQATTAVDSSIISALRRIGTDESRSLLNELAISTDSHRSALASSALTPGTSRAID